MMHDNTNKKIVQAKFTPKKQRSIKLSKSYIRLKLFKRAERISHCGDWLKFAECMSDHKKLIGANFCRDRLCPMCGWRRSLLLFKQILRILHVASARQKTRYLFLTLTVKNASPKELNNAISAMFEGFERLFKHNEVDKNMIGWIRNLEITYNEKDDTYHPHFHVLLGVRPTYFDGSSDHYISQKKWTTLWQKAARLDYVPIVNIKAVKPKKDGQTVEGAVAETSKYSVKDSDYIRGSKSLTDKIVNVLAVALKGRRLIGFGKQFRQIRRELKQADVESKDVDLTDGESACTGICPICNSTIKEQLYQWDYSVSRYVRKNTTKGGNADD